LFCGNHESIYDLTIYDLTIEVGIINPTSDGKGMKKTHNFAAISSISRGIEDESVPRPFKRQGTEKAFIS